MRIGIDTSPLTGGHAGRGTGTYTRELVGALKAYTDVEIIELHRKNHEENVDLIHYPYFDPFFLTLPLQKRKPTVVTVHDLIPLVYPEHFPPGIRGKVKWNIQKRSLMGVKAIITDSEASKNDIARLTHFPHDKIFVIYLAPGEQFKPQGAKEQEKVKGKYKLTDSFVLYVGDVNWNKNIPTLIRAMKGVDVSLVLVGNAFLHHDLPEVQLIQKTIEETNQREKIIMLGYIPDSDLPAVYSLASLYVQPSIAEGFGLPVLEAMACGTPAVVSLKTSLAEIAGPSILVDPEDSKNIKSSIQEMLKRDRKSESQKARDWAARFTWEKTAVETVKVYKGIL